MLSSSNDENYQDAAKRKDYCKKELKTWLLLEMRNVQFIRSSVKRNAASLACNAIRILRKLHT
jgi:hypothetical protein